jgi:hypothetical protein
MHLFVKNSFKHFYLIHNRAAFHRIYEMRVMWGTLAYKGTEDDRGTHVVFSLVY